ncbi:MAG: trypsin-like peptidase domain-containing protein [Betaproteobacteria bacterium]|nr:trypsin-like peptidase domain-containing protein [Betaproteobacteria bacterium]MCC6250634.1 trypsin-like peptidase domain-containing protein [Rubrivivax sp.]
MWRRIWLLFAQGVTVALAALFVVATLKPEWLPRNGGSTVLPLPTLSEAPARDLRPTAAAASGAAGGAGAALPGGLGFSQAARRAAPAVVSITATKLARNPHADDPRFRFFFGDRAPAPQQQLGLGSGVIVSPEGYLLTNHHVVADAVDIEVQLADGRGTRAVQVGSDVETDIAVLKIDLDNLPVLALADGRSLQVGDAVLAIGNPFNIGQTVTAGIVSALDRTQRGSSPFQSFIQTDAAINPGNSGGALVDAHGSLVGINTAIFSRSGGHMGIGFAVPVDTARQVMEQLVRGGKVRRGFIGVDIRDLNAELAESLSLPVKTGVLITGVLNDGPAAKGGVRPGDVVVRVGDRAVANSAELLTAVAALAPDSEVQFSVQRGAEALSVRLKVGERPSAVARPGGR